MRRIVGLLGCGLLWLGIVLAQEAPGAPGAKPFWTSGAKQGIGTATSPRSKVWFTLGDGALEEVYYPTIDQANTHSLEFAVSDGKTFVELESTGTEHKVEIADPRALVYRQVNTSKSGKYKITKTYVTDTARATVLIEVRFQPLVKTPLRLFLVFDPSISNSGYHDAGAVLERGLVASEKDVAAAVVTSLPFRRATVGYAGTSDGWTGLQKDYTLGPTYTKATDGNVVAVAEISPEASRVPFTVALAFADKPQAAYHDAILSLQQGFAAQRAKYSAGWHAYLKQLAPVDAEFQRQYDVSAMVLKAHEDKTYPGAGAASLTIPWGNEIDASEAMVGGYHLVWARDLYQVATAFLAEGDRASADRALSYLFNVQQKKDGSFPQNSWLDGRPYWPSLQMDEVAFPLILAYQLGRADRKTYEEHVRPAANFLVTHGPATPQERWEEESGYSPSTIAAEIAGLICAADLARRNGDEASRALWLAAARDWREHLTDWTFTTTGPLAKQYFLRIAQQGHPEAGEKIELNNGAGTYDEREVVDAGFLELVRLGIARPADPLIAGSVSVVDKTIKVDTPNGPSWYRYNHDGYGEKADGAGYNGTGIGRLWVLLTGERGEYELARGEEARPYLRAMQSMANEGGMLAEQVWDREQSPRPGLKFGAGTGSATPLAWTNAQFVRLARGVRENKVLETPQAVVDFFQSSPGPAKPRLAVTPIPGTAQAIPGQKIEIGATAEGGTVVYLSDDNAVAVKEAASFRIPVQVAVQPKKIAVAVYAGGASVFQQIEIKPSVPVGPGGFTPPSNAPSLDDPAFVERLRSASSPIIDGVWVTFIYRGQAKDVEVVGDFTDWDKRGYKMKALAGTDVRYLSIPFPPRARAEYKLIVDGDWQLDRLNPNKNDNGVGGENSFFTMPQYKPTAQPEPPAGAPRGALQEMTVLAPEGPRKIKVYLPAAYQDAALRFPVLYWGDGQEYIDRAAAVRQVDALIARGEMRPVIMVFIPPHDRWHEYWMNDTYVRFLADTVVPEIDQRYRTVRAASGRALAGPSLGGLIAAYAALRHPELFGNVYGQSSAFSVNGGQILGLLQRTPRLPIRWYLEVGRFEGLLDSNREWCAELQRKGYDFQCREHDYGHNWTHWGDVLAEGLTWLFPDAPRR